MVGLFLGSAVFFYASPGKPKIGIINIPFTVINDRSAFEIGAMLDFVRLLNLGVEPYLAAAAVIGCLAQRLVRHVCPKCGVPSEATATETIAYEQAMQEPAPHFVSGPGCNFCNASGFVGRSGVFEVLAVDEAIRRQIAHGASGPEIRDTATGNGMVAMRRAGMQIARSGKTSVSEVFRDSFLID